MKLSYDEDKKLEKKYICLNKKQKLKHILQDIKCSKHSINSKNIKIKNSKIPFNRKIKIIKDKFNIEKELSNMEKLSTIYFRGYTQLFFINISSLEGQIKVLNNLPKKEYTEITIYYSVLRDTLTSIYKYFFDMSNGNTLSIRKIYKDILLDKNLPDILINDYKLAFKELKTESHKESSFQLVKEDIKSANKNLKSLINNLENLFSKEVILFIENFRHKYLCHNDGLNNIHMETLEKLFKEDIIEKRVLKKLFSTVRMLHDLSSLSMSWSSPYIEE